MPWINIIYINITTTVLKTFIRNINKLRSIFILPPSTSYSVYVYILVSNFRTFQQVKIKIFCVLVHYFFMTLFLTDFRSESIFVRNYLSLCTDKLNYSISFLSNLPPTRMRIISVFLILLLCFYPCN